MAVSKDVYIMHVNVCIYVAHSYVCMCTVCAWHTEEYKRAVCMSVACSYHACRMLSCIACTARSTHFSVSLLLSLGFHLDIDSRDGKGLRTGNGGLAGGHSSVWWHVAIMGL